MYLDDGIIAVNNYEEATRISNKIRSELKRFGFIISEQKSDWSPKQMIQWLGFNFDFKVGYITLSADRMNNIKSGILEILQKHSNFMKVRKLASLVGRIQSAKPAVGNLTSVMTKYCHMTIETKCHWDSIILIGEDAKSELLFWNANLYSLNGQPFVLDKVCTAEVFSDASSIGYGGYVAEVDGSESIGCWSGFESKQSSTWRELKAVLYVLQRIGGDLIGRTIKWKVDNINVVHIMRKGSMKVKLQNQKWGTFTGDRFATSYNAKCVRFNSKIWFWGTESVDCFSVNWSGENNWIVPPPRLINSVLKKLNKDRAKGVLVVPVWRSAPFWPVLFPDGGTAHFI
jgi:hypothetical protein